LEHLEAIQLTDADRVKEIDKRIGTMERLYHQWSQGAKAQYRFWNNASIALSAAVPVVVLVPPLIGSDPKAAWVAALAGILGAGATLCRSIDSLYKNHDTWLRNNDAYGKLKGEHFLFYERAGPYKGLEPDVRITTYAERVESLIGSETGQWTSAEKAPQAPKA
jgi:hypothetical protein